MKRWSAYVNFNISGDSYAVDVDRISLIGQDSMQWGHEVESMGASFVPANWQLRVSVLSDIVDIPSNHLSVSNIPLSGCMDILSN